MTATTVASALVFASQASSAQSLPRIPDSTLDAYPTYNGDDLELKVDDKGTHFTLWSPGAEAVRLHLYTDGHNGKP